MQPPMVPGMPPNLMQQGKQGPTQLPGSQLGEGPEMLQEHWMKHFCEREEFKELQKWMQEEGLSRPRGFEERLMHAERCRELGNTWFGRQDFRRALHCTMAAVHSLDFTPHEQMQHPEEQKRSSSKAMLPIMSNLAMIFLKRGDAANAEKAASAGLKCAGKLPDDETAALRAKLRYRRGLARGEKSDVRNLDGAREDLLEAARLDPTNKEIRTCLENCKALVLEERRNDPLRYRPRQQNVAEDTWAEKTGPQAKAQADADAPEEPYELPPAAEKFAMIVGTSLGRIRRVYRSARHSVASAKLMSVQTMAAVALGPALGWLCWQITLFLRSGA